MSAFGPVWRVRPVYIAVFAGYDMALGEAGHVDFPNARDRILYGGPDGRTARMRTDPIHQWLTAFP